MHLRSLIITGRYTSAWTIILEATGMATFLAHLLNCNLNTLFLSIIFLCSLLFFSLQRRRQVLIK